MMVQQVSNRYPGSCTGDTAALTGVTPSSASVCEGTPVSLTLSGLTNGVTDFAYTVNGDPFTVTGVTVTGGSTTFDDTLYGVGTYNVIVTSATIGGCTTTFTSNNTTSFTVKPNPTISGVSPSASEVCEGASVSFTASGLLNGVTDFTYAVTNVNHNNDPRRPALDLITLNGVTVTGGTYTFPSAVYPVGTYEIIIVSATVDGCLTEFTSGNTASFIVNPNPVLDTVSANAVCDGTATDIHLTGLLHNSSGVITYTINGGSPLTQAFTADGNEFSFATAVLTMADNGHVVEITKLTNNGTNCETSFTGKTATLVVQATPNAGTDGALSVCIGSTPSEAQLFAALGGSPDTGGTWSHVGLIYTYTVNATSPCTINDTATVTVSENPLPTPVITGANILTCANPTATLSAGSYASYVWSPNGETTSTITTIANTTQTYSVTVTDANGCSNSASYTVTYYPVTNQTTNTHYSTIQAAITAANPNDVINICKGTYTETININKALTLNGPNAGTPGTGSRVDEAILTNCSIDINNAGDTTLDGLTIFRNDATAGVQLVLDGGGINTVQNCIFERKGSVTGTDMWALTTTTGGGNKVIKDNKIFGDNSGGLFSGHKSWARGIYIDKGAFTVSITGNTFMYIRSAMNMDDYSTNNTVSGNTFSYNGTHISLGGAVPTTGSYSLGANNFINDPASTMINLSSVAESFRFDITSSKLNGTLFGSLTDAQLFDVEARMAHKTAAKKGKVIYKAGNQYVNNFVGKVDVIQNSVKYADANDVINLQAGTYPQNVDIDKSNITLQGVEATRSLYVLNGATLASGANGVNIRNGKVNVAIKNLTISGFTGGSGNSNGDIYANGLTNGLTIDNVAAVSARPASGIYISGLGDIQDVTVNNCLVSDHGAGARGIVIWNGFKKNIKFTNNTVTNNNCCGIELADGTASGVTVTGNTITIGSGDNGIGLCGLNTNFGPT
ncbi:hypothetical protein [Flavobacterium sp. 3HN19-14]|uniref:hypothetical protein n=1 Tax=Flavobacterium sp. 3HN19-14 TaxID=3448133 RepID=UPI003EE1E181